MRSLSEGRSAVVSTLPCLEEVRGRLFEGDFSFFLSALEDCRD